MNPILDDVTVDSSPDDQGQGDNAPVPPKRRGGRKKGSKNKPKLVEGGPVRVSDPSIGLAHRQVILDNRAASQAENQEIEHSRVDIEPHTLPPVPLSDDELLRLASRIGIDDVRISETDRARILALWERNEQIEMESQERKRQADEERRRRILSERSFFDYLWPL